MSVYDLFTSTGVPAFVVAPPLPPGDALAPIVALTFHPTNASLIALGDALGRAWVWNAGTASPVRESERSALDALAASALIGSDEDGADDDRPLRNEGEGAAATDDAADSDPPNSLSRFTRIVEAKRSAALDDL